MAAPELSGDPLLDHHLLPLWGFVTRRDIMEVMVTNFGEVQLEIVGRDRFIIEKAPKLDKSYWYTLARVLSQLEEQTFDEAVPNPVGARRAPDFWSRHVRYFWCRRAFNLVTCLAEPFTGGLVANLAAGVFWAGALGLGALVLALLHLVAWLALEAVHLRLQGWPFSWRAPLAWALREFLIPVIWLRAVTTRTLVWQDSRFDAKVT